VAEASHIYNAFWSWSVCPASTTREIGVNRVSASRLPLLRTTKCFLNGGHVQPHTTSTAFVRTIEPACLAAMPEESADILAQDLILVNGFDPRCKPHITSSCHWCTVQ